MRRILTLLSLLVFLFSKSNGQSSTVITQQVDVSLTNIITIEFSSTGTSTGSTINLPLNLLTDLLNGVASSAQQLNVSSTKTFNVSVKANASNFTYVGSYILGTLMPIAGKLKIKVPSNSTGGAIAGNFANYTDITTTAQNMITGGTNGADKLFSIQYQGIPGLGFALGTYTAGITFTATQQ